MHFVCAQLVSAVIPDPGRTERLKALKLQAAPDIGLLTSWPGTLQPCFGAGTLVIAGNGKAVVVCVSAHPLWNQKKPGAQEGIT